MKVCHRDFFIRTWGGLCLLRLQMLPAKETLFYRTLEGYVFRTGRHLHIPTILRAPKRPLSQPPVRPAESNLMHVVLEALKASGKLSEADFDFLRERGRPYVGARLPAGLTRQKGGQCLDVADQLEEDGYGKYVRGFGLTPLGRIMGHAWNSRDGRLVIDASWTGPQECSYFGIPGRQYEARLSRMSRPFMANALTPWRF